VIPAAPEPCSKILQPSPKRTEMETTALAGTWAANHAPGQPKNAFIPKEKRPLIVTIITVTYNSEKTVGDTLLSVMAQNYDHIEHIIIDGCSTDSTLSIVNSFPHVSMVIQEKDKGIYDAMNKGLQLATGDVIGILNSDDVFASNDVISNVIALFEKEKSDTVYGDLHYVDQKNMNRVMRKWTSGKFRRDSFRYGWMPPHPTFFVKKEVYKTVGLFNLSLKSAADYEMMLRVLYKHRFNTAYLHQVMVKMRAGGASNGAINKRIKANSEDRMAWKLNELKPYFFTLYLKPLRKIFQFINKEQMKRLPLLHHFL
jgi:glycosyltransferase involved in cell wall biosynthesis